MRAIPRRSLALVATAVLGTLFAFSAVAGAGLEYPPDDPTTGPLDVPPTVVVGGEVAVSGKSCGPNQTVTITFNGVAVATATTDASGTFSTSFSVPAGTTPGQYSVVASNSECVLSAVLSVTATRALAFTGSSNTVSTVWVAAGLIVLGAGLVFVARRRLSSVR